MRERPGARALLWIALFAIAVALVRFGPDRPRVVQPAPAREAAALPAQQTIASPAEQPALSAATHGALPSPDLSAQPSPGLDASVEVTLRAPAVVDAGATFDVELHASAPNGMHRLQLAVRFDRKMLTLTGVSEGAFPVRALLPVDFAVDEPSEGNVQIVVGVRDGLAVTGAGAIAVLHFESGKAGAATISLPSVGAFDSSGSLRFVAEPAHAVVMRVR